MKFDVSLRKWCALPFMATAFVVMIVGIVLYWVSHWICPEKVKPLEINYHRGE